MTTKAKGTPSPEPSAAEQGTVAPSQVQAVKDAVRSKAPSLCAFIKPERAEAVAAALRGMKDVTRVTILGPGVMVVAQDGELFSVYAKPISINSGPKKQPGHSTKET